MSDHDPTDDMPIVETYRRVGIHAFQPRERIEAILRTAPGEHLMRPAFGAGLEQVIAEPNTVTTRTMAQERIVAALAAYEDRILLDGVEVAEGPDPRELLVTIAYRLRPSGEPGRIDARVPVGAA